MLQGLVTNYGGGGGGATKQEGVGTSEVGPLQKREGAEKVLAML